MKNKRMALRAPEDPSVKRADRTNTLKRITLALLDESPSLKRERGGDPYNTSRSKPPANLLWQQRVGRR